MSYFRRNIKVQKVIVIGSPGSGKSTFSRALRDKTDIPLYYLDIIYHKSDRTTVSKEAFDSRLCEILEKDSWIIDGHYSRTLDMRLEKCDTVFLFNLPKKVCLDSVTHRIGTRREDMPWIEESFDEEFYSYIENFPETTLPKIFEKLEKHRERLEIHIFHSRNESESYLKS